LRTRGAFDVIAVRLEVKQATDIRDLGTKRARDTVLLHRKLRDSNR
jgi:hypothetical protein